MSIQLFLTDSGLFVPSPLGVKFRKVNEWTKDSTGKAMQTDIQALDDSGLPLWSVDVLGITRQWGAPVVENVTLFVGARECPDESILATLPVMSR